MINIKPNVKKTLESMKSSGYSLNNAIADIVDNSIDAHATEIRINVDVINNCICIIDNGIGMEFDLIVEALRLGSDTGKVDTELGKYGFGLKSASFSQCNIITVVSQKQEINEVTFDINKSIEKDDWIAFKSDKYLHLLEGEKGTAIIWNDLYRLGSNENDISINLRDNMENIRMFLSKTFYDFLENDIKIYLNDVKIEGQSPFYEKSLACKILNKDEIKFGNEEIKLRAYDISSVSKRGFDDNFLLEQGISVFRNKRFISNIGWVSRSSHPSLNMIRIRMDIGSKEDYLLNIDFKKSNVNLPVAIRNEIETFEKTAIKAFGKSGKVMASKRRSTKSLEDIDFMQSKYKVNIKNAINQMYLNNMKIAGKTLNNYLEDMNKLNKIKESKKLSSSEELFMYELLEKLLEFGISYDELLFTEPYNKFGDLIENHRRKNE